jgi:hypothetical protein
MSPVDLAAICTWPMIGAGFWLGHRSKSFPPRDIRGTILGGAAGLLLVAPLAVIFVLYQHNSAIVTATQYGLVTAIGAFVLFAIWRTDPSTTRLVITTAAGFLMFGGGLWYLAGDFILRRDRIEGIVSARRYEQTSPSCVSRCSWDYFIELRGHRYVATREVFDRTEAGERIRADLGRASHRILYVQTLPF